jgi:flagellar motility protein MotE (MotC chaperone)
MSDLWKKFKGVFVVEDPNQPQQPTTNSNPSASKDAGQSNSSKSTPSVSESSRTVSAPTQPIITGGDGKVNEKFMEVLFKAMEAINTPAFDYFEYRQAVNNLASMPMDEATRYKSAYAMAQTMGASSELLINSANGYLAALQDEDSKFQQAANNQAQSQIGNKQAQIDNFDAVIKQKNEQIKRLLDEIEQHKKEMEQLKLDISQSTSKVAQTKSDFDVTYHFLTGQIQKDVENMKNYLK